MTALTDRFTRLYSSELEELFGVTGFPAEVTDTGGGALDIECDGGDTPGTRGERLLLCATNSWDGGLADEDEERNQWFVTLRDEDMEIVASGEDPDLSAAVRKAYALLRATLAYVATARREILEDVDSGTLPRDVANFSALHDHVDANMYADEEIQALEALAGDDGERRTTYYALAQGRVDAWIRAGMPRD